SRGECDLYGFHLAALLPLVQKANASRFQTVILPVLDDLILHRNREPRAASFQADSKRFSRRWRESQGALNVRSFHALDDGETGDRERRGGRQLYDVIVAGVRCPEYPAQAAAVDPSHKRQDVIRDVERRAIESDLPATGRTGRVRGPFGEP